MRKLLVFALLGAFGGSAQDASGPIIRAEKKLVLVDVVVTDKKGQYVQGLTVKDFKLWEDKDEQNIETFSTETDPASPLFNRTHYLILFFDNSTMDFAQQAQARAAATSFIDKNMAENRMMAVVNFGGALQIAQNFTNDAERLKKVVSGVKFSTVPTSSEGVGAAALTKSEMNFGARSVLEGLRGLAKNLGSVPGRKTLIFLSGGFKLDGELRSELTAVIDVCNKNNVAVYPIDTRGLVAAAPGGPIGENWRRPTSLPGGGVLVNAAFVQQHPGGGGVSGGGGGTRGGTGTTGSGGTRPSGGGTTTGTTGTRPTTTSTNPLSQPRSIVPHLPDVSGPQDVLYALAQGTGGFVILNTNDLLGGLDRIAHEQNEYYILGYSPGDDADDGACHELKVKVNQGGLTVRSRTGYCAVKPIDLLAGSVKGKELESRAAGTAAGTVAAKMQSAFFYTAANTARVDVAMEMPGDTLQFKKEKGKMHAEVNILGIAYSPDGGVAAKFSDTMKMEFQNKKEAEAFQENPLLYETQFDIASGNYKLKVVFSGGGEGFGKLEAPLVIDPYDTKNFSLSTVAMSRDLRKVSNMDTNLDASLLADRTPLIAMGTQLTPSASNVFSKDGPGAFYLEIYRRR